MDIDSMLPPALPRDESRVGASDFGGGRFTFPRSCYDIKGRRYSGPRIGGLKLTGDPFTDLPEIINRFSEVKDERAGEIELVKAAMLDLILGMFEDNSLPGVDSFVSGLRHAVVKIENSILESDLSGVMADFERIRAERDMILVDLNQYRVGALAGRTAHTIALRSANDMHRMVERLIDSHPYYDGEVRVNNPKRIDLNALKHAFGSKRELAKATRGRILGTPNVGMVALERVIETFAADGMPCVAELDISTVGYCEWTQVSGVSSRPDYRWYIPNFINGEGAYLTRSSEGLSYLMVAKDAAPQTEVAPNPGVVTVRMGEECDDLHQNAGADRSTPGSLAPSADRPAPAPEL